MQIIRSLIQTDLNSDFRNELSRAIQDEITLQQNSATNSHWLIRLIKRFSRTSFNYHAALMISVFYLVIAPGLFAFVFSAATSYRVLSIEELRMSFLFAPSIFLGGVCCLFGFIPLSETRGRRNAIYPVPDDCIGRWTIVAMLGLFSILLIASLSGAYLHVAPVVSVSTIQAVSYCLLNGLLLTSLAVIVIRIAPPTFEHGSFIAGATFLFGFTGGAIIAMHCLSTELAFSNRCNDAFDFCWIRVSYWVPNIKFSCTVRDDLGVLPVGNCILYVSCFAEVALPICATCG